MIGPRTKAVCLTHVPTQGGLVNPAAEVGRVARDAGITYLLDACQSLGQVAVDVRAIGCDVLSSTGRKFLRGPRGTGLLYVAGHMLDRIEPPFIDGHSATPVGDGWRWRDGARRFEAFEQNFAGKAGLATAIAYARTIGIEIIEARIAALAAGLRDALAEVPGVTVQDLGAKKCGIVTFVREGRGSEALRAALARQGINVSVSISQWAPRDFAARGLPPMVRASVHAYNTEAEVERFVAAVAAL
jgi:selenocysteine lyase/cysteine desulfurase